MTDKGKDVITSYSIHYTKLYDAPSESFGCAQGPVHGGVRKDEGKFLTSVPGGEIARSGEAASWSLQAVQQPADFAEDLIAHHVSVNVVDLFEIIEIDEEERERSHGPGGKRTQEGQRFLKYR